MILRFIALVLVASALLAQPRLAKKGTATQLIVEGKPFLVLGGELLNSSASSLSYMEPLWPKLAAMQLNTVLAPVSWELLEPEEGKFDYTLLDGLIENARRHRLRLVLLWFGSWKNTYSSYVPAWVKRDQARFPRVKKRDGSSIERLTPLCAACRDADARAFAAMMRHLRATDGTQQTVLMVQVENEVGSIPEARDHSPAAEALFAQPVPKPLLDYLDQHRNRLVPEFRALWDDAGGQRTGSWQQVFGNQPVTDDLFMAWHYAQYIDYIVKAGKAEYALPMFVNAALIRPNYLPGQYNSGGPLPHSFEIWRAGGPSIDFFTPDIYFETYASWAAKYQRADNPLFVPEARAGISGAANAFYTFGRHDAIGFSPFAIDAEPADTPIGPAYETLSQLAPLLLQHQGAKRTNGVVLEPEAMAGEVEMSGYRMRVVWASQPRPLSIGELQDRNAVQPRAGVLFINSAQDEFYVASSGGALVYFSSLDPSAPIAGIESIDEGKFVDGRWQPGRRLNGDEDAQGQLLRLQANKPGGNNIYRVRLYRYR